MTDQELAELRVQEIHLNKLADVAKKEHDAAVNRWWKVNEAIKNEEQYRRIEAQVRKRLAESSAPSSIPGITQGQIKDNLKTMLEVK